jgi:hypothetical protein
VIVVPSPGRRVIFTLGRFKEAPDALGEIESWIDSLSKEELHTFTVNTKPMKKIVRNSLHVQVSAFDKDLRGNAAVYLSPTGSFRQERKEPPLQFQKQTGTYVAANLPPGRYVLSASADRYQSQQHEIIVQSGVNEEKFILERKGMPAYYRGKVKVPFEPDHSLLAVTLHGKDRSKHFKTVLEFAHRIGLFRVETKTT